MVIFMVRGLKLDIYIDDWIAKKNIKWYKEKPNILVKTTSPCLT